MVTVFFYITYRRNATHCKFMSGEDKVYTLGLRIYKCLGYIIMKIEADCTIEQNTTVL